MTRVGGSELRTNRRRVITEEEFEDLCYQADRMEDERAPHIKHVIMSFFSSSSFF